MPRTLTSWSVGCPALGVRPAARASSSACPRTAPFRDVLLERRYDQARMQPVARQVAVQVRQALAVAGRVAAQSVSHVTRGAAAPGALVTAGHWRQLDAVQLVQLPVDVVEAGGDAVAGGMFQPQVEGAEEADRGQVDAEPSVCNELVVLLPFEVVLRVVEVNGGERALAPVGADGVRRVGRKTGGRARVDDGVREQDVGEGHDAEPRVDGGLSKPGGVLRAAGEDGRPG